MSGGRLRVRAASVATSAAIVVLLCLLLLTFSRVTAYFDEAPVTGVEVEIAPREVERSTPARRTTPTQRTVNAAAPPTQTPLPVDREMSARALSCFDGLDRERRADCPRPSDEQLALEAPGGNFPRAERNPRMALSQGERDVLAFMGVDPPCIPGLSTNGLSVSYCQRFGIVPEPPSRSAEQICIEGGIGPCRPPEFRPEDVARLPHTQ